MYLVHAPRETQFTHCNLHTTYLLFLVATMYKFYLLLGHISRVTGKIDDAKVYYKKAEDLVKGRETGLDDGATLSFIYQQLCVHVSGNNDKPLKNLTPLLSESSFSIITQVVLHQALGNIYRSAADWHSAKTHFKLAIHLAESNGHVCRAMECRAELGRVYRSSGCHSKALKRQKFFLDFAIKRGDTFSVANSCGYIGFTYYSMGEQYYGEAVKYLYSKLSLCKNELEDSAGFRWCLNNMGKVYLGLKKFDVCMKLFAESAEIAKQHGNMLGLGTAYGNLGSACRAVGKHSEAVKYHKLYLEIAEKNLDTGGMAIMQRELILDHLFLFRDEKNELKRADFLAKSRAFAFEALHTSLEVRSRLSKDDDILKIGNFEHNQAKIYSLLLFIIIQQEEYEVGLVLSELGRAHALADRIRDKFDVASTFSESILSIVGRNNEVVPSALSAVLNKIDKLIRDCNSHILVYSVLENPLSMANVKETLLYTWHVQKAVDDQDTKVQVHFKQSVIHLQNVESNNSNLDDYISDLMRGVQIREAEVKVRDSVLPVYTRLSRDIVRKKNPVPLADQPQNLTPKPPRNMKPGPSKGDKLEDLYKLLIEPMSQFVDTGSNRKGARLVIIPYGFLFGIPFCALKAKGAFLIEKFVISMSPSLYLLDIGLEMEAKEGKLLSGKEDIRVLAVGNPKMPLDEIDQLPGAESEVKIISSIFNSTQLLCGESATKKAVCDYFPSYSVVHLATHAIVAASLQDHLDAAASDTKINPYDVGDYSVKGAIILARSNSHCSGVLTSSEIEKLHLDSCCELVVLSCCNTACGKITGDGILGLSRSFMCAGVRNMIVTLWPIVDDSTALLKEHFYRHYAVSRDAPAALQASMLHLIRNHYKTENWAAFCCVGMLHAC